MYARRSVRWLIFFAALGLTACGGGSGSSGFDAFTENFAIQRALETQSCVPRDGITICPADAETTLTAPGRIHTGVDTLAGIRCIMAQDGACNLELPFLPEGFPASVVYRVAIRNLNPAGKWRIGAPAVMHAATAPPSFDVPVAVPRAPTSDGQVQIAVLVFLDAATPAPSEVDELADSGAAYAYVTEGVALASAE